MVSVGCKEVVVLPLPQCSNYTVKFSGANSPSPEACLFLHGFPAASREFPMQEKNQDIAAKDQKCYHPA